MVSRTKESAPARDWLSVAARYSPSGHGRHRVLSVAVGRIKHIVPHSHMCESRYFAFTFPVSHTVECDE